MNVKKVKTGAVVVLYEPEESEFKNLLDYAGKVDITIVADNSPRSNQTKLNDLCRIDGERVIYKHYPENIGLCKALNIAIQELCENGCEWVLTMNSDSSFQTDILEVYKTYLQSHYTENTAILGPVYDYDRKPARPFMGTKEVGRIMLSGSFINTAVFQKLNGYAEELFIDGLDWEYCLHARKEGYKIIKCGQAILNHRPGITKSIILFSRPVYKYGYASPQRYFYMGRACIWLWRKYKAVFDIAEWLYRLAKILILFPDKKTYIKKFIAGTREGLNLPCNVV